MERVGERWFRIGKGKSKLETIGARRFFEIKQKKNIIEYNQSRVPVCNGAGTVQAEQQCGFVKATKQKCVFFVDVGIVQGIVVNASGETAFVTGTQ